MGNCSCGCNKPPKEEPAAAAKKTYVCMQCNVSKEAPASAPAPECCGKKMKDMD